ncbi:uncharacterized protein BCR38DRAFT_486056 [Pseudomassariella vexata]|uniref:AB hydrolase-1 domain-containing protein n=1 Tax=Pseudomassariella vexata TaxID=1141098 RepID=A0A1Y2DVU1_9PEZI|nr:uncharacterized protein BCR38DRAFT_486056 [Pseudomassariella vexata]ORY63309.1 hypothetical protein BCR38DRAFT_486056 [Pseudomassariella vexata]
MATAILGEDSLSDDIKYARLPSRGTQEIAYRFLNFAAGPNCRPGRDYPQVKRNGHHGEDGSTAESMLLVFINGLILSMASWNSMLHHLSDLSSSPGAVSTQISSSIGQNTDGTQKLERTPVAFSALLYDRYGQGLSIPSGAKVDEHSFESAVTELQELLDFVLGKYYTSASEPRKVNGHLKVVLVSHSIGVPLARLFVSTSVPSTLSRLSTVELAAHIFLDSNISTADYARLIPNPDAASFDPEILPPDASAEQLRDWRAIMLGRFAPNVQNPEGLSRTRVASLVPSASEPKLRNHLGVEGGGGARNTQTSPYLSVLGHHPAAFAAESERSTGLPGSLALAFIQPEWEKYNSELSSLVSGWKLLSKKGIVGAEDREKGSQPGVSLVYGAGHFIQRDRPDVVAQETFKMVQHVAGVFHE